MRTRTGKESVESRGGTSWNDGLYPIDGGGACNGGCSEAESFGVGTGGSGREGADAVGQTTWFAPVETVLECKDGVCPVPWAVKEKAPAIEVDQVNHPPHYTKDGGIECIEAIEAQLTVEEYQGYLRGNCVKYLWRWRNKGGKTDLAKAQWYLDRLMTFTEAQKG